MQIMAWPCKPSFKVLAFAMEEGVVHTPLLRWRKASVRHELIRHIIFERVDHPNLQ
jgi:hypothetical protein